MSSSGHRPIPASGTCVHYFSAATGTCHRCGVSLMASEHRIEAPSPAEPRWCSPLGDEELLEMFLEMRGRDAVREELLRRMSRGKEQVKALCAICQCLPCICRDARQPREQVEECPGAMIRPGDIVVWWRTRADYPLVFGPGRPVVGVVTDVREGLVTIDENGTTALLPTGDSYHPALGPHVIGRVDAAGLPVWRDSRPTQPSLALGKETT